MWDGGNNNSNNNDLQVQKYSDLAHNVRYRGRGINNKARKFGGFIAVRYGVYLGKMFVTHVVKKFSIFMQPEGPFAFYESSPLYYNLRQFKPVRILIHYFSNNLLNRVLRYTTHKWNLLWGFRNRFSIYFYFSVCAACPTNIVFFNLWL
jgi:hypothetical protein